MKSFFSMGPEKATKTIDRSRWPRPLAVHLNNAAWGLGAALFGGIAPENPHFDYAKNDSAGGFLGHALQTRLWRDTMARDPGLAVMSAQDIIMRTYRGIRAYQVMTTPPVYPVRKIVWRLGAATLHDVWEGVATGPDERSNDPAHYVLLIPSLINGPQIFDIRPDYSFAAYLAGRGLRPLYLDWGAPADDEKHFGLSEYVSYRLMPCIDYLLRTMPKGARLSLVGYCMGGTILAAYLAMMFGGLHAGVCDRLAGAVFLASPWDFHADPAHVEVMRLFQQRVAPLIDRQGVLEGDWIQTIFACLDPAAIVRKFHGLEDILQKGDEKARHFIAVEDWLNSGPDLSGPMARMCLSAWYDRNEPASGTWMVNGKTVDPAAFDIRSLCVIPSRDRLVPPDSARAFADKLPKVDIQSPDCGHIGLMSGHQAKTQFWPDIADWITGL